MTKKRLAALLMAVLLCISCMNVGYAECAEHDWVYLPAYGNDDGHEMVCKICHDMTSEEHQYDENHYCPLCDHQCEHLGMDHGDEEEDDSDHIIFCASCGYEGMEKHTYDDKGECSVCGHACNHSDSTNGVCDYCGTVLCEHGNKEYFGAQDSFHQIYCPDCDYLTTEKHTYVNGECSLCDYACEHSSYKNGECEYCGAVCEHVYGTNGYCTKCNTKCEHVYGTDGYCTKCNTECEHVWDYEFYDDNSHEKNCNYCGKTVYEAHGELSYVVDEYSPNYYHTVICGICEEEVESSVRHEYELTNDQMKCTLCNHVCTHDEISYQDVADDIHDVYCDQCMLKKSEKHTYVDGECSLCNHVCKHSGSYNSENKCEYCGTPCAHEWRDYYGNCEDCGFTCEHTFNDNHVCTKCDWACGHASYAVGGINDEQHSTECDICGAELGTGNHDFSDGVCGECNYECKHTAGFDDDGLCLNCRSACKHKSVKYYDYDDEVHFTKCETCGQMLPSEEHSYVDGVCQKCEGTCEHTERTDEGNCKFCDFTCEHTFNVEYVCTKCDWTCGHKLTDFEMITDYTHKEYCEVCDKTIRNLLHSFKDGYCATCDYTCTHDAEYTEEYKCPICGLKCQHEDMTYTPNGTYHDGECKCGYTVSEEKHTYVNSVCTLCGATCTKHEFNDMGECQICDFKCSHNEGSSYNRGITDHERYCIICNFIFETGKHTFNEKHICSVCSFACRHPKEEIIVTGSKEATATEPGATGDRVCTICDAVVTPSTPIVPTNFTELQEDVLNTLKDYYNATYLSDKFDIVTDAAAEAGKLKYDFEKSYAENMAALQKIVDDAKAEIDKACEVYEEGIAEIDELFKTLDNENIFGIIGKMMGGADADTAREITIDSLKEEYCALIDKGISHEAAMQEVTSMYSAFDNICKAADAVDEAAGDSKNEEILKIVDDFYAQVENAMKTGGLGIDVSGFSDEAVEKINALKKAAVDSVKVSMVVNAGTPAWFTVKTTTNTASLKLLAENMGTVKTWTKGYTDEGDVRTWEISYNFINAGQRTLYFQPVSADSVSGEAYRVGLNVLDNACVNTVWYDGEIIAGKAEHFTVTTSTNATALTLYAENKGKVKTWTKYTDKNGQRTWEIDYTFVNGGDRYVYFAAANRSGVYGSMFGVDMKVTVLPTVKSAAFAAGAMAGVPVTITVKTSTDAAKLEMLTETKAVAKTWTTGYTDANGVRTWKVSYSFINAGTRNLYFRVANKSGVYSDMVSANVTVSKKVETKTAAFAKTTAKVGEAVTITVKTGTNAKKLALCAENGVIYGSWNADGKSKIVGNERVWTVTYKFATAGNRNIGFKASEDGKAWGTVVSSKITITK